MTLQRFFQRRLFLALIALAATATLLFFGAGLHPWRWLTWIAPLPVLALAPRVRAWEAFTLAALAWLLGSLNLWEEARTIGSTAVLLVLLILPAITFGFCALLFRAWILRGGVWQAALSVPIAWVAAEFLCAQTSAQGTLGNLGYTQSDFLPIIQVASIVGLWGISFCLLLVPATVAALLSRPGRRAQKQVLFAGVLIFFAAVLTYGHRRLEGASGPRRPVSVALVAGDQFADLSGQDDDSALRLYQQYADEVNRNLRGPGLSVAILPEKIARLSEAGTKRLDALFLDATSARNVNILVGIDRETATARANEARMYGSDRTILATYVKQHPLPAECLDVPGTEIKLLYAPSGVWGMEICTDMDFPNLCRQYGAHGVGLLLVPASDFGDDGWLHSRMAILRGVESDFTIVRTARQGLLTISDGRGRVLAEKPSNAAPITTLLATPSVRHDETLYVRYGDWFGWSCVAALFLSLASVWRRASGVRRRKAGGV
jgi:apolipoprotein N-acyltransferase